MSLVFPNTCISCEENIAIKHDVFCVPCKISVGTTNHFHVKENELLQRLSGRIEIHHVAALFNFLKDGGIQKAIHALKYGKRYRVAHIFGRDVGKKILNSPLFYRIDTIVPIPIHWKKRRSRGYNQCEEFGQGISEVIGAPLVVNSLLQMKGQKSQTQKNRSERFQNVLESFVLKNPERFKSKSILLVDDVVTTGATVEAAYHLLKQIPDIKIQIALIALAND